MSLLDRRDAIAQGFAGKVGTLQDLYTELRKSAGPRYDEIAACGPGGIDNALGEVQADLQDIVREIQANVMESMAHLVQLLAAQERQTVALGADVHAVLLRSGSVRSQQGRRMMSVLQPCDAGDVVQELVLPASDTPAVAKTPVALAEVPLQDRIQSVEHSGCTRAPESGALAACMPRDVRRSAGSWQGLAAGAQHSFVDVPVRKYSKPARRGLSGDATPSRGSSGAAPTKPLSPPQHKRGASSAVAHDLDKALAEATKEEDREMSRAAHQRRVSLYGKLAPSALQSVPSAHGRQPSAFSPDAPAPPVRARQATSHAAQSSAAGPDLVSAAAASAAAAPGSLPTPAAESKPTLDTGAAPAGAPPPVPKRSMPSAMSPEHRPAERSPPPPVPGRSPRSRQEPPAVPSQAPAEAGKQHAAAREAPPAVPQQGPPALPTQAPPAVPDRSPVAKQQPTGTATGAAAARNAPPAVPEQAPPALASSGERSPPPPVPSRSPVAKKQPTAAVAAARGAPPALPQKEPPALPTQAAPALPGRGTAAKQQPAPAVRQGPPALPTQRPSAATGAPRPAPAAGLLGQIQGFKAGKLTKTETVDKSAPAAAGKVAASAGPRPGRARPGAAAAGAAGAAGAAAAGARPGPRPSGGGPRPSGGGPRPSGGGPRPAGGGGGDLLSAIQGFSKGGLRKATTRDASKPKVAASSAAGRSGAGGSSGGSAPASGPPAGGMMAAILAQRNKMMSGK